MEVNRKRRLEARDEESNGSGPVGKSRSEDRQRVQSKRLIHGTAAEGGAMRESEIQSRILVALCAHFVGRSLFVRINSGKIQTEDGRWVQLAPPGTADIIGTVDGRSVAIECKAARGAQRETQRKWQAAFEKAGGVYLISRDAGTVCASLTAAMSETAAQHCDTA